MKDKLYLVAKCLGLFALCRWLTRRRVRVLAYHGIWLGDGHFGNFLYMSPKRFERRMALLKEWGYPVISLGDAVAGYRQGSLPDRATVITIDDGWYGTYLHMLPVLEASGFPATVYVTTYYCENQQPVFDVALQYMLAKTQATCVDLSALGVSQKYGADCSELDCSEFSLHEETARESVRHLLQEHVVSLSSEAERQQKMHDIGEALDVSYERIIQEKLFHLMTVEQVSDMARRGIDVQLHTHRHRISSAGKSCLANEIADNASALKQMVSNPLVHFCYPSGVYQSSLWPELEATGIVSATTTDTGLVSCKSHPYELPRILDGEQVSELEFEAEMSGVGEIKRMMVSWLKTERKH